MKKLKITILIVLLGSITFTSCESFLEEKPTDRLVENNFYNSAEDAESGVNSIYQVLYDIYGRLMFLLNEQPADDNRSGIQPNQYLQNLEYLRISSENQFVRQMWERNYKGIARANSAINNISNMEEIDEDIKNRLLGEARFLRSLYYFNLVRFFGDVPLITIYEGIESAMGPRVPVDQVYQQIIDDLNFAENNLPVSYSSNQMGRATKGAAKILLGKVHLKRHNFEDAVSKLGEVVENESNYGYGLHDDFVDNWKKDTETELEAVFYIEYMDDPFKRNNMMLFQAPVVSLPGGSFAPLGINSAFEADTPTMELYMQFSDEDERREVTFRTDFVSLIDGSIITSSRPMYVKYWEENEPKTNSSDRNFHIVRYADAILMYAEALNETGQTEKATQLLNRVRERAFNSTDFNYSGLSQSDFQIAVYKERRLEFADEGHRWFDLVRQGRFVSRMKEFAEFESQFEPDKTEIGQNVQEHHNLMPIPQREMDLNPALVQNPGY